MGKVTYRHNWIPPKSSSVRHRLTAAIDKDARVIGIAVASRKDQFSKKIGNKVALKRIDKIDPGDAVIVIPALNFKKHGLDTWGVGEFIAKCLEEVAR